MESQQPSQPPRQTTTEVATPGTSQPGGSSRSAADVPEPYATVVLARARPERQIIGTARSEVHVVNDSSDVVIETVDGGWDTIRSSVNFTLSQHVERLVLTGIANLNGRGNADDNRMIGNAGDNTLEGFNGDDSLAGGDGNDVLYGDAGNDRLVGGCGDDFLSGGFDNDVLIGGAGDDTYLMERGMGQDYVYDEDSTTGNTDIIRISGNLGRGDIEVFRDQDDMLLRIAGSEDGMRISNWFSDPRYRIEEVHFPDGVVWNAALIELKAGLQPSPSVMMRFGRSWSDALRPAAVACAAVLPVLPGQQRNSIFRYGGPAQDTLTMKRGGWFDLGAAAPMWTQNVDTVMIDAGIAPESLKMMRIHEDLVLLAEGEEIGFLRLRGGADRVRIEFADGLVWDNPTIRDRLHAQPVYSRLMRQEVLQTIIAGIYGAGTVDRLNGTSGDDWMFGFRGNDILRGFDGNDNMYGGEGNDHMSGGRGADQMHGGAGDDFLQGGEGRDYLSGGDGADTVTGGDGNDVINGGLGNDMLYGAHGDDILYGGPGDDWMWGGPGSDFLHGGPGRDTYHLHVDMGRDVVDEGRDGDSERGDNLIEAIIEVQPDDIEFLRVGHDLKMGVGGMQHQLHLKDLFDGGRPYIEAVVFRSGGHWDFAELERRSIAHPATAGNDVLHGMGGAHWWQGDALSADIHDVLRGLAGDDWLLGHAGNDLLDGGAGNDRLEDGAGSDLLCGGTGDDLIVLGHQGDVVVFNGGDGHDTIVVDSAARSVRRATLSLGGVRSGELALRKSGRDLVLLIRQTDSITFEDWYQAPDTAPATVLQVVVDSCDDYLPDSQQQLHKSKIVQFDFNGLATQYDLARIVTPALDRWSLAGALTRHHLSSSDTMAMGGQLAYHYAHSGQWSSLASPGIGTLANTSFGHLGQSIA